MFLIPYKNNNNVNKWSVIRYDTIHRTGQSSDDGHR